MKRWARNISVAFGSMFLLGGGCDALDIVFASLNLAGAIVDVAT
ncbi:MAG: hypothetical protein ACYTHJ_15985 [Planctomycetota bacterium]|jgi:hypothetical protein